MQPMREFLQDCVSKPEFINPDLDIQSIAHLFSSICAPDLLVLNN